MAQDSMPMPIFRRLECSKVYMDAKDKNVAKTVIYVNDYDASVKQNYTPYADQGQTRVLSPDELLDAFIKGAVVSVKATDNVEYAMVLLTANCTVVPKTGLVMMYAKGMIDGKIVCIETHSDVGDEA